ncbi:MAG: aminotransferase class V-fold PLP-dependent enzyme [Candidatus Eisenbacteria bacterium]|nr:aminotransferase class V-fold PLP-dependent enzyme [Candidatus Eisenbacteria bacterium]
MANRLIYFDNVSGIPVSSEVLRSMLPFLSETFGNPSSLHWAGDEPRRAIEEARQHVSDLIGSSKEEIIFTSSGSEANNLAIKGYALANRTKGNHVVVSQVEHFSVLHSANSLEGMGFRISRLPVDSSCMVDPEEVKRAIGRDTILVSVMHSNNEVGTIEPIREIAAVAHESGIAVHTDCVSSCGNVPLDVNGLGIDLLTLSANQFGGPKGAAALYVRKRTRMLPQIEGGIQESGLRAGIENTPAIVGMGKAAEIAMREMPVYAGEVKLLRDELERRILESTEHISVNGHRRERLPGHLNLSVDFVQGEAMLAFLNDHGVAASSGSSCASRALKASHVLTAMGIPPERAQSSLLFTLWRENNDEEVELVANLFPGLVKRLRDMSPLYHNAVREKGTGKP